MSQATLTFAGVLLGAIIASGASLLRERVVTARERAAKAAEREQQRQDLRDAFQRESLLALQDAMNDFRRATVTEHFRKIVDQGESGSWNRLSEEDPRYEQWRDKEIPVKRMWARVFDPELRGSVESFRLAASGLSMPRMHVRRSTR